MGIPQSQAAQASMLETQERYVWEFPDCEVRILMEREAVETLREAARNRAGGGLLLGDAAEEPSRVVTIRALVPLPWSLGMDEGERGRFEEAVKGTGAHGRAVGCFRVQSAQELFPNAGDLVLMKSFFREPACIFLLLERTASGDPGVRFFFWDGGLLRPGWTSTGSAFDYPRAKGEEAVPAQVSEPEPVVMPVRRRGRARRFVWVAAAMLPAAGIVAALSYTPVIGKARTWLASSAAPRAEQPFALEVERKTGDLVLTWDRSAPAIKNAVRAVLFIRDGAAERSYDVDITQLETGTVYYTPQTGDVQLRLEVYGANDVLAVASARVLSAALPPPLPLAAADAEPVIPPVAVRTTAPVSPPPAPPASDYTGPRAVRQVSPGISPGVRAMLKSEARVEVKVGINEDGRVDQATVVNQRGGLASGLAEAALGAARMWRFEPARDNGRPVRSEMILNFRFTR